MELNGIAAAAIVLVRVFNNYGVPAKDLQAAQAEAQSILRDAGVGVGWISCEKGRRKPVQESPRCQQPLAPNDLVLRIATSGGTAAALEVSMGFSLVSKDGSYLPVFSTIYADRVTETARRAGTDFRQLLARAIAHEIGHLLLNSNQHAASGLMRRAWSHAEIRRDARADWVFLDQEAETMRAASVARARAN